MLVVFLGASLAAVLGWCGFWWDSQASGMAADAIPPHLRLVSGTFWLRPSSLRSWPVVYLASNTLTQFRTHRPTFVVCSPLSGLSIEREQRPSSSTCQLTSLRRRLRIGLRKPGHYLPMSAITSPTLATLTCLSLYSRTNSLASTLHTSPS